MNHNLKKKVYKGYRSEEEANLQIMTNLVLDLTAGSCVLNKRHRRAIKARKAVSKRILMPEDVGWEGLAFGKLIIMPFSLNKIWEVLNFACSLGNKGKCQQVSWNKRRLQKVVKKVISISAYQPLQEYKVYVWITSINIYKNSTCSCSSKSPKSFESYTKIDGWFQLACITDPGNTCRLLLSLFMWGRTWFTHQVNCLFHGMTIFCHKQKSIKRKLYEFPGSFLEVHPKVYRLIWKVKF